jgi:hypothetical protein
VRLTVAPDPGSLRAVTRPFIVRARRLLSARPAPPIVRSALPSVAGASLWKSRVTSGGRPLPVSLTDVVIVRSPRLTRTDTAPPGGVKRTAFARKLSKMRRIAQESPIAVVSPASSPVSVTVIWRSRAVEPAVSAASRAIVATSTAWRRSVLASIWERSIRLSIVVCHRSGCAREPRADRVCWLPSSGSAHQEAHVTACVSPG